MTAKVAAMIGAQATYHAPEELGRAAIRYFSLAVGDSNPLYTDDRYAREHGYPGVVAPPTLLCETNQYANLARDVDGYAGHSWRIDIPGTRLVRGGNSYVFHRPVVPTDVVTATWRIADIQERRNSRGTDMLIVTSVAEFANQHGDRLVTNTETLIVTALDTS